MAIPNLVPSVETKKIEQMLIPPRHSVENQPVHPQVTEPAEMPEPLPKPQPIKKSAPSIKPTLPAWVESTVKPTVGKPSKANEERETEESPEPNQVMTKPRSERKVAATGGNKAHAEPAPEPRHLSADLLSQQIALVTTELNKSREAQAKQQRIVYINEVNAHKDNAAAYQHDWYEKVENIGNLNFPDEARRKNLTGSLLLDVAIKADGSIYSIKVRQSSGEPVLDEAAKRIARMAAPFAPFPPELREEADVLVIPRIWRFSVGNRIDTSQ